MQDIPVTIQKVENYSILIEEGMLGCIGKHIQALSNPSRVFVITEARVNHLYGAPVVESFLKVGILSDVLSVPEGETSKSLATADWLYERLLAAGAARRDVIIAMGGGMIMDLAGFVAATYMRGLPYVNLPTSLVAQLDAGIGGKVAVNHARGKNIIGAFYHPSAVYIDPSLLATLPVLEILNGLSEAIKVAIINSATLFDFIEDHRDELVAGEIGALSTLINGAAESKLQLLTPDPFEIDLKRALNFGHTIGHVLETLTAYVTLSHGQAVSIGMATATRLAVSEGMCDRRAADRIITLLESIGLPVTAPGADRAEVKRGLRVIEAVRGRALNFVVPTGIGTWSIIENISFDHIVEHL